MKKLMMAVAGMVSAFGLAFSAQAETCADCITFTGKKAFTVNVHRGDECTVEPTLEWSTNRETWTSFDLSKKGERGADEDIPAVEADGKYVFYVRGSENRALGSDGWDSSQEMYLEDTAANMFEIKGSEWLIDPVVSVSGNIETLLDWQTVKSGGHPAMDAWAFSYLFYGCELTSVADLVLPATTLTDYSYAGMFCNCRKLTDLPALPATTLSEGCYMMMFGWCKALEVNASGDGTQWSIPAAAAASAETATDWNGWMFSDAGGTIADEEGAPVPGTTYYVASAKVPFEVHITGAVVTTCYDGTEQMLGGFTFTSTKEGFTAADFVFTGTSNLVGTAAGTYKMNLKASDFAAASDSSFKDATFVIDCDGTLVITQRVVTLTSASQTWSYDGEAHSAASVEATGFVDGEGVTFSGFPSVTGPDVTVTNTFTYSAKAGTDLANYAIVVNYGLLTVPAIAKSTVTPPTVEHASFKVYTNGVEVVSPYVVLRDAVIKVVYTADAGYEFGFNLSRVEATFTADQETMTVPAGQMPAAPVAKTAYAHCLTFSSATAFSVAMKRYPSCTVKPKLQWSTDKINWQDWDLSDTSKVYSDDWKDSLIGGGCVLYLRGIGNAGFAARLGENGVVCYLNFVLVGSGVSCSGNIETLLDCQMVAADKHPTMGAYAFYALFKDCSALVSMPDLPATALMEGCYQYMFDHCSGLKINATGPGAAWSLPAGAVKATNSTANMFDMTGGDFTGEPVPGTIYYIGSADKKVQVTPQTVEHTMVRVFVGETEIEKSGSSYPVQQNATVRIVYEAENDYEFAEDIDTVEVTIVADQDDNAVPADKLPIAPVAKMICNDCLAFSSAAAFTVALTDATHQARMPNLQWSTDRKNWKAWDFAATPAAEADSGYAFYLRGTNNTALATVFQYSDRVVDYPVTIVLDGTSVECSGNIETLLDWKTVRAGSHPTMTAYAFCSLFKDCAALATTPELPATTLAEGCYREMFFGCTALTALPTLPATDFPNACYYGMFNGCSSLAVNRKEPGVAWSLPTGGTLGEDCFQIMFAKTGSDWEILVNNVSTGITYYVYSAQPYVTLTPQVLGHATVKVYVGDNEIVGKDGSFAVHSNDTVTVVYTADAGYEFAGFVASVERSFMVDKLQNVLPEELVPAAPAKKQANANCIAFMSSESFTVALAKGANNTATYALEWSTNRIDWTAWDLSAVSAVTVEGGYAVYFRGSGNTAFASDVYYGGYFTQFVLKGSRIACSGNIETLLDWQTVKNGGHPTMGKYCFCHLFENCTALVTAPALPATTLAEYCYSGMFQGCTGLTAVPALPATSLERGCYDSMFKECSGLVVNETEPGFAFSLPVSGTLYANDIFKDTSGTLTGVPYAKTTYYVYSALPFVTVVPNPIAPTTCKVYVGDREIVPVDDVYTVRSNESVRIAYSLGAGYEFSEGVSTAEVAFVANEMVNSVSADKVPQPQAKPLCEDCVKFSGSDKFSLKVISAEPVVSLEWSTNRIDWSRVVMGVYNSSFPTPDGHVLYLRGSGNTTFAKCYDLSSEFPKEIYGVLVDTDATVCSGDIETLLDWKTVSQGQHPPMGDYAFCEFFTAAKWLVDVSQLKLPATNLTTCCFLWMFNECKTLRYPPALPATTLAASCYAGMFQGCHLSEAPALPATELAFRCYHYMFSGCSSLTKAPALPATKLADNCYEGMFSDCTSLVTAPALPATSLKEKCYQYMFRWCTALKEIPSLNFSSLAEGCCTSMFEGCSSLEVNLDGDGLAWSIIGNLNRNDWKQDMFKGTAGTLANANATNNVAARAPFGNVAYYIKSAPWAKIVPQTLANTTVKVYSGSTELPLHAGGYTVRSNETVTVVYTATDGTKFPGFAETTSVTFAADRQICAIPDDLLPAAPLSACRDCLTFTSAEAFSVSLLAGSSVPSLEKSSNLFDWTAWDGQKTEVAAGQSFYVRGTGNKLLHGARFVLTGSGVRCYGDIETLLDWQTVSEGNHPEMGASCYAGLFKNCTALVEIPTLPATTLTENCYLSMFEGCSSLVMSIYGEGLAWSIPASAVTASGWNGDMFKGAADGSFPEPEFGEVYRIAGVPLVSVPQSSIAVDHTTCRVFAFGLETAATADSVYEVRSNAVLRIVYAPEDGYAFADGSSTYAVTYVAESAARPSGVLPSAPLSTGACEHCLVFSSMESFTLAFSGGSWINFEWSVDRIHWNKWRFGTGEIISAAQSVAGEYVLYVRGNSSYPFSDTEDPPQTVGSFVISGAGVACYGNVETLMNWQTVSRGDHPWMWKNQCYRLFANNPALVSIPTLPAVALETQCYYQMFDGCSNVKISKWYDGMAWSLPANCGYYSYTHNPEWSAWEDPDVKAPGWREDMFRGMGLEVGIGTSPEAGVVYHITSATAMLVPQTVPRTTFRQSKTSGFLGDEVTVEYFADAGYVFADGSTNVTATFAMDQVRCPVPDWLLPAAPEWGLNEVVTFTGEQSFSVNFKVSPSALPEGSVEWSTNRNDWQSWECNASVVAGANDGGYALYVRGSGMTAFAKSASVDDAPNFVISSSDKVSCFGNVETLLDWRTVLGGHHPQMGKFAFLGLFRSNPVLVTLPELPAVQLAEGCYASMFDGCTALVVNTNGNGVVWSIPAEAAESAAGAANWNANMFRLAGGNAVQAEGAPVPGVIYRVGDIKQPKVMPQTIDNTTYKVYVGETEIFSPYEVDFRDTVTIVYTVKNGYIFNNGEWKASVSYTVTDQDVNVVIPVDGVPVVKSIAFHPGDELTYATEAEARLAAKNLSIECPETVMHVISPDTYVAMFELKAVQKGETWTVEACLKPATSNAVQQAIDATTVQESLVATMTNANPSAVVKTQAGLYYGMAAAADIESLDGAKPPSWVLGNGKDQSIPGQKPANAKDKAFYRLRVEVTPVQ